MKNNEHHFQPFNASAYRVGIVCAKFNGDVTEKVLTNALEKLNKYQVLKTNITVKYVAGSVELPIMLQALAKKKKYDCLIAIGAVILGQTDHYTYVCKMTSEGILRVMLDYSLPVGFAVLTVKNKKLAMARISIGGEAVEAALQTVKEIKK